MILKAPFALRFILMMSCVNNNQEYWQNYFRIGATVLKHIYFREISKKSFEKKVEI